MARLRLPIWPGYALTMTLRRQHHAVEFWCWLDTPQTRVLHPWRQARLGQSSRPGPDRRPLPSPGLFMDPVDRDIEERRSGVRLSEVQ